MKKLIINTSKTEKGYSASCDIIVGWVVAYTGDFSGFVEYVKDSIDFYVEYTNDNKNIENPFKNDKKWYPVVID